MYLCHSSKSQDLGPRDQHEIRFFGHKLLNPKERALEPASHSPTILTKKANPGHASKGIRGFGRVQSPFLNLKKLKQIPIIVISQTWLKTTLQKIQLPQQSLRQLPINIEMYLTICSPTSLFWMIGLSFLVIISGLCRQHVQDNPTHSACKCSHIYSLFFSKPMF